MVTVTKLDQLIQRAQKIKSHYPYMAYYEDGSTMFFSGGELVELLSCPGSGIIKVEQKPDTPKEGVLLDLLNGVIEEERGVNNATDESPKD